MTKEEWMAEGNKLFGEDIMQWKFECPVCHHVQSVQDYKDAGAPETAIAFSCVGRWIESSKTSDAFSGKKGPCSYAGGGLFRLNPVEVDGGKYFAFAR